MEVTIRRAEKRDVPAMLSLVRELAVFEREPQAVEVTVEEMTDAGFGKRPVWYGWVAEIGSEDQMIRRSEDALIVGMAICYERYSTWKGRTLYLEDLVVKESVRGNGIGERLFKACADHAIAYNMRSMIWQVLDWNVDAIRFYERLGAQINGGWLNGTLQLKE